MTLETERPVQNPCSIQEAKEILGKKNVFGPEEWLKYLNINLTKEQLAVGHKFNVTDTPEIPWSQSQLEHPEINQEHFLFLGINHYVERTIYGGESTDLKLGWWYNHFPAGTNPRSRYPRFENISNVRIYDPIHIRVHEWWLCNHFATNTCGIRWYLMPVSFVTESDNLPYEQQVAMLPIEYEVPNAIERIVGNVLYCMNNKKYLDKDFYARVSDKSDDGMRVAVNGDSAKGIKVNSFADSAYLKMGIASSRKLP